MNRDILAAQAIIERSIGLVKDVEACRGRSRELALVLTKLDEARLWLDEFEKLQLAETQVAK